MGQQRPSDARVFRGERDRGDVHMSPLFQPACPSALGIGFTVDHAKIRACSVHEERAEVAVATSGDGSQPRDAAAGVWRGVMPSEAAKLRPLLNTCGSPMVATKAVAVCGPMGLCSVTVLATVMSVVSTDPVDEQAARRAARTAIAAVARILIQGRVAGCGGCRCADATSLHYHTRNSVVTPPVVCATRAGAKVRGRRQVREVGLPCAGG